MNIEDRDHREVGRHLNLFHFQDEAPGMVFWHPRGFVLYRALEEAIRAQARSHGYHEIKTPQIMRRPVWEASGHWQHFRQHMFRIDDQAENPDENGQIRAIEAALKPVSCPGNLYVAKAGVLSYRDLPLRLSELGVVHRDEKSGTLHGLLRVRQFTQDDGHIFCEEGHAVDEVVRFCRAVKPFYAAFGFKDVEIAFSTRPADRAGDDASWDLAEGALASALDRLAIPHVLQPGAGAFYGPKLEFVLKDSHGRSWQCGTIQFDLVMPRRFDLRYVDRSGERRHPVMLHRALYGSLERFLGIVLEEHGKHLPAWLAPVQAAVLPVSEAQSAEARSLADHLVSKGIRAVVAEDDSLARRIAESHDQGIPHLVVLGNREIAEQKAMWRQRQHQQAISQEALSDALVAACAPPSFAL